ncbi:hypothetical protein TUM4636_06200 [Shewanella glacialipiscicola]|uniref:Uncharacterized protein n=1 Tax=Shewanella glacialipiscicola TaxID=614069 RepID=A0ABQ6J4W5_9GAMM|nr:hypothetical protein TUM4636_06200 [Shewanella glacialipiscicola]GMA82762.1 hypothetical protein GCM10025855_22950 [Shewanella glacialipiscicola]
MLAFQDERASIIKEGSLSRIDRHIAPDGNGTWSAIEWMQYNTRFMDDGTA